jgi:hypothetical protein
MSISHFIDHACVGFQHKKRRGLRPAFDIRQFRIAQTSLAASFATWAPWNFAASSSISEG